MPKHYSETERIGTMLLALEKGVGAASEELTVPRTTIYEWFREGGGIEQIRSFVESHEQVSALTAKVAVYEQVRQRVATIPDADLMTTFRAMLDEGKGNPAAPAVAITNVQAQQTRYELDPEALARALVTLQDAGALEGHTNGHHTG